MREPFYVTKRGHRVKVQSFPHLLPGKVQVAAEKKAKELFPAVVPTYDEPLMGGGVQTFEHDDKSVEGNPEATEALNQYRTNLRKQTAYVNEKMMQFYILTGTEVQLPDDDKWRKRQEFFGIELPDDENELTYHYITTEIITDARELMDLVERIMEEAGIDPDTLDAARETFRGVLGEQKNSTEGTDAENGGVRELPETLVHLAKVPSVSGDGEMADFAVNLG